MWIKMKYYEMYKTNDESYDPVEVLCLQYIQANQQTHINMCVPIDGGNTTQSSGIMQMWFIFLIC